ncbi:DDE-type integrase/transposase/recombinase [[Pasteurella] aerogenes]|nr:DDE-type integrase/transposase/recombinase [[Pasteurella] aerogenes]
MDNLLNRQVVGWKLSRHHDAQLVIDALNHAMLQTKRTKTMLFHSDQGSIYGSKQFTLCVQRHNLTQKHEPTGQLLG